MADKKLDILQEDIKLLKGEIKQSLVSVRDYLLNMELPSSEIATILAALGADGEQKITMQGNLASSGNNEPASPGVPSNSPSTSPTQDDITEQEEIMDMDDPVQDDPLSGEPMQGYQTSEEDFGDTLANDMPSNDMFAAPGAPDSPDPGTSRGREECYQDYDDTRSRQPSSELYDDMAGMKNDPMPYTSTQAQPEDNIPRVNMLANLINWVSRAKQEIGYDQLSTFLEVYGISGHLSPELKDIILHLAEITGDKPAAANSAGVWSESMLTLHGILTGGEAPVHPVLPSWSAGSDISDQLEEDEIIVPEEEPQEAPVKLKLVFPSTDGKNREFCIDLAPEQSGDDAGPRSKQDPERR